MRASRAISRATSTSVCASPVTSISTTSLGLGWLRFFIALSNFALPVAWPFSPAGGAGGRTVTVSSEKRISDIPSGSELVSIASR